VSNFPAIHVPPKLVAATRPSFVPQPPPGTELRYYTRSLEKQRTIPQDAAAYWGPGGRTNPDYSPTIEVCTLVHVLVWIHVDRPPWPAIRALLNRVNSLPFLGRPAERILFRAFAAEPAAEAPAFRPKPIIVDAIANTWTLEYQFQEAPNAWTGDVGGWNAQYTGGTPAWATATDAAGNPFYASADLAQLFEQATS
jgi:hypothetical protein